MPTLRISESTNFGLRFDQTSNRIGRFHIKKRLMSSAFVKENEEQWLHEVAPTVNALVVYLTRENNGVRVYEQKVTIDPKSGKEVHWMSNGLSYAKDNEGKWYVF